ncbi:uncharacterized protein LOC117978756 isoform X2 [Pan paniscus]|uniref:uncharacterized protein LOC117978756 isoform X2 n=1 Tax=Pan paniscus TaxID=9597 RepID=UPI003005D0A5
MTYEKLLDKRVAKWDILFFSCVGGHCQTQNITPSVMQMVLSCTSLNSPRPHAQLMERTQSSNMETRLDTMKVLAKLSADVTFATEFINMDGIIMLMRLGENGTKLLSHLIAGETSNIGQLLPRKLPEENVGTGSIQPEESHTHFCLVGDRPFSPVDGGSGAALQWEGRWVLCGQEGPGPGRRGERGCAAKGCAGQRAVCIAPTAGRPGGGQVLAWREQRRRGWSPRTRLEGRWSRRLWPMGTPGHLVGVPMTRIHAGLRRPGGPS